MWDFSKYIALVLFVMFSGAETVASQEQDKGKEKEVYISIPNSDYGVRIREHDISPVESNLIIYVYKNNNQHHRWFHDGMALDSEGIDSIKDANDKKVKFVSDGGKIYMFVSIFSGGGRCCWSVNVYELTELKLFGNLLDSSSSLTLRYGKDRKCLMHVTSNPVAAELAADRYLMPTVMHCFNGAGFLYDRSAAAHAMAVRALREYAADARRLRKSAKAYLAKLYLGWFPKDPEILRLIDKITK